jgi:hypothetical protein
MTQSLRTAVTIHLSALVCIKHPCVFGALVNTGLGQVANDAEQEKPVDTISVRDYRRRDSRPSWS